METVGHLGSRQSLYNELGLDKNTKLIGCVGRLEYWKGQHIFLQSVDLIVDRYPNTHFIIVGEPTYNKETYLDELRNLQKYSKYPNQITFLGRRNDIASIMCQLSVLVHSSILPEPFGLVVMEAMANETIVVAADDGGVRDQIVDCETGYLYMPGNQQDMAEKVCLALSCPDPHEIKEKAKQYIDNKFQ